MYQNLIIYHSDCWYEIIILWWILYWQKKVCIHPPLPPPPPISSSNDNNDTIGIINSQHQSKHYIPNQEIYHGGNL